MLQCGHEFHEVCVTQLRRFGSKSACPVCRVESDELTPFENLYEDALSAYLQQANSKAMQLCSEILDLDASYPPAVNLMGLLYVQGCGVPTDADKATQLFKEAYAAGELDAALNLGHAYLKGKGVPNDDQKALSLFREAHERGNEKATHMLGMHLRFNICGGTGYSSAYDCVCNSPASWTADNEGAMRFFQQAYSLGSLQSALEMSLMYQRGLGVKQDLELAVRLVEHAYVETSSCTELRAEAAMSLGMMYFKGEGVKQDFGEALRLLEEKDADGKSAGPLLLFQMYHEGKGVQQNLARASRYLTEAFRGGFCSHSDYQMCSDFIAQKKTIADSSPVDNGVRLQSCGHCGNKADRLRCGRCHVTFYCSPSCQRQDWPNHKRFCGKGSVPCGPAAASLQPSPKLTKATSPAANVPSSSGALPPVEDSDGYVDEATQAAIAASIADMRAGEQADQSTAILLEVLHEQKATTIPSPAHEAEDVGVVVLATARMPEALQLALRNPTDYPALTSCLNSMVAAGWLTQEAAPSLPTRCGAKIFLVPEKVHIQAVLQAIDVQGIELRNWHIVTTPDLEEYVLAIIDALSKKEFGGNQSKTKRVKQRVYIPVKTLFKNKNTFLSVSAGTSMHSGPSSGARTASEPEAGAINPRSKVSRSSPGRAGT